MTKCITGSSGFVGKALSIRLLKEKYKVFGVTKGFCEISFIKNLKIIKKNITAKSNWYPMLKGVDHIIHCAALNRGNIKKNNNDKLENYLEVNTYVTSNFAEQAANAGVKRFVFLSSIFVNGNETIGLSSFNNNDISQPKDDYSTSKFEAEKALLEISKQTGLEVVIIRAPLIYGEGVKGNFLRLLDLVYKQIPLPLAKINNLRSFIGLNNLIDLIICCIDHPKAAGKTFLVSDGEDISTSDLIRKLSKFMNKSPRLFKVPQSIIKLMGRLVGKSLEIQKLLGSLRVDNSDARKILGWSPALSLDEGLEKTVRWYLKNR